MIFLSGIIKKNTKTKITCWKKIEIFAFFNLWNLCSNPCHFLTNKARTTSNVAFGRSFKWSWIFFISNSELSKNKLFVFFSLPWLYCLCSGRKSSLSRCHCYFSLWKVLLASWLKPTFFFFLLMNVNLLSLFRYLLDFAKIVYITVTWCV